MHRADAISRKRNVKGEGERAGEPKDKGGKDRAGAVRRIYFTSLQHQTICVIYNPRVCTYESHMRSWTSAQLFAQRSEARPNLCCQELRLLPGRKVAAFVELVV